MSNFEPPAQYTPSPSFSESKPNSTLAIVSLVSGILGFTFLPVLGSIVAIITGHMAKNEIKKSAGTLGGNGMATAGLILGYLVIALGLCAICAIVVLALVAPDSGSVFSNIIESMP